MLRKDLVPKIMDAVFVGGGRLFGVDVLMEEWDWQGNGGGDSCDSHRRRASYIVLYTVDPSGNWK